MRLLTFANDLESLWCVWKVKSGQDRLLIQFSARSGRDLQWRVGRGYSRRASYDVITHVPDLSLKPHKQDGRILETGRPKVSVISNCICGFTFAQSSGLFIWPGTLLKFPYSLELPCSHSLASFCHPPVHLLKPCGFFKNQTTPTTKL